MEKDNVLVSIIVPVYNVESYLEECLNSIVKQTYKNIEVILINDGSTDNSLCICEDYVSKYHNIQVISQENKGLGPARNRGVELSKGDYLMFVDSDDWIVEDAVELFIKSISDFQGVIDFVDSSKYIEYNQQTGSAEEIFRRGVYGLSTIKTDIEKGNYLLNSSSMVCMKLFRREFIVQNNIIMPALPYEDNAVLPEIVFKANNILVSNKAFYVYRINRGGSIIQNAENRFKMVKVCEYIIDKGKESGTFQKYFCVMKRYIETRLKYSYEAYTEIVNDEIKRNKLQQCYKDFYKKYFQNQLPYEQYKYFLLGGFGSRTVVQGIGENIRQLEEHIPFSSLIAQMTMRDIGNISIQNDNAFRKETIYKDISGELYQTLINLKPSKEKYFVIDLLEERYDVAELADGNFITLSEAYMNSEISGIEIKKIYKFGTIEHESLWKEKCRELCELLKKTYIPKHIILIKAKLSTRYLEYDSIHSYENIVEIEKANETLENMYGYIEKYLEDNVSVYEYTRDIYSSNAYRHGREPQYYDTKFYDVLKDEVRFNLL